MFLFQYKLHGLFCAVEGGEGSGFGASRGLWFFKGYERCGNGGEGPGGISSPSIIEC